MLPVNGRPVFVMESANDRMRLKDKIVSNVAKAVKSIQELKILAGSGHVTLSNYDWQCHRLCEHLDHSLLHGLRHVTPGYWKLVSEFTHRDCIKEIKRMRNVTTDLGRGRAWLFMALNETLLECYMRCYQQNESLVEDYYVKDALVRDQDRFNVLLTLTSGLENIEFQLDCDVPYLDLCVYPPNVKNKASVEAKVEFDKLSICSMESIHPGSSRPLPQAVFEEPERQRSNSQDSGSSGSDFFTTSQRYSPSVDSGVHSDWNYRQRSITPIIDQSRSAKQSSDTSLVGINSPELEVIRINKKGKPQKNKKKKRKFVSVSSVTDDIGEARSRSASEEQQMGGKIEIPPLDDLKLSSAIKKSTLDEPDHVLLDSEKDLAAGERIPGDGLEESVSEIKNDDSVTHDNSAIDSTPLSEQIDKIDEKLDRKGETVNKEFKTNKIKSTGGTFTEMLKARVDDIVNAELDDSVHDSVDAVDDDIDVLNEENDSDNVQYKTMVKDMVRDVKSKVIYNMDENENDTTANTSEITNNIPEVGDDTTINQQDYAADEPSIYSKTNESDSYDSDVDDDNDFYVTANSSKFSQQSQRSTPSRQSNTSTPSRSSNNNTPARFTPVSGAKRNSVQSSYSPMPFYENNKDSDSETNLSNQMSLNTEQTNQNSDLSDYEKSSNRNTPDFFSTNQKRRVSASSRSSYDTEDNDKFRSKASSRPQSAQSVNRASPNISIASQHSNLSTDPELQGTEQQALQAKVEELIEQKKLYTRITFSEDEEEEGTDGKDNLIVRPRTSSLRAGEVEITFSEDEEEEGADGKDNLIVRPRTSSLRAGEVEITFSEDEEEEGTDGKDNLIVRRQTSSLRAGEVGLDNNSILYLSLDILQDDDENVIRMFCCRQGHTEGKTKTVFILITTHCLYLLQDQGKRRFQTTATIPYLEIDFVSVGYNSQTLHIACKNKRQQYWLTTGEERVTVAVVDCLAHSMENSEVKPGQLQVDTRSLAQKISLNKYITKECHCDPEESEVMCYSLVHWEDPTSTTASCESDREGVLYYKSLETTNILGTQTWKLGYAVLRDGMLCLYNDKNDSKPTQFLSMNEGQCVGCKRDFNSDKNHSIKIILSDETSWCISLDSEDEANRWLQGLCQAVSEGLQIILSDETSWCISLDSEDEANRWLQGLCQAVSEGLQMNPSTSTVIPCCMILSKQKLLMCHEDLETNFVRTLGSASVPDITAVLTDEVNHTFLILAFDSSEQNVSSERWVLYFNSDHECSRFKTELSACWLNQYQVEVPELSIDDFTLEKKSRSMATYLKSTITLK